MTILNFTEATLLQKKQFISDIEKFKNEIGRQLPDTYTTGETDQHTDQKYGFPFFNITEKEERDGSVRVQVQINNEGLVLCKFNVNTPELFNHAPNYSYTCPNTILKEVLSEVAYQQYDNWQSPESFLKDIIPSILTWLKEK